MRHLLLALALALPATAAAQGVAGPPAPGHPLPAARPARPELRGMGLTLDGRDPTLDWGPLLAELPPLGVDTVTLFVDVYQRHADSPAPARDPVRTPQDAAVLRVMATARRLGLEVAIVPVVLLSNPRPKDWRGNLQPRDRQGRSPGQPGFTSPDWGRWFRGYDACVLHFARLAEEGGASLFCVGSELCSTEAQEGQWRRLIREVRQVFPGELTYSANWDHYRDVPFWSRLDAIGLSGYFELATTPDPSPRTLRASWVKVRDALLAWRTRRGLSREPLLFVEVGYASLRGCASHPWDYTAAGPCDLLEQAACYRAFVAAWRGRPELLGVSFYEWRAPGGPGDTGYTPRGKPALQVLRRYFGGK